MTTQAVAVRPAIDISGVEKALVMGDLSGLPPGDRITYYSKLCASLDLNPLTIPFAYVSFPQGGLKLYCLKSGAEQLRGKHGVSVQIVSREYEGDMCIVTARATTPDGREDTDFGAVHLQGLQGEKLANALMKAVTKAKRRVTLSLLGLGMLDETEVESVAGAVTVTPRIVDGTLQLPQGTATQATTERKPSAAFQSRTGTTKPMPEAAALAPNEQRANGNGEAKPVGVGGARRLANLTAQKGVSDDQVAEFIAPYGVTAVEDLTQKQLLEAIAFFSTMENAPQADTESE